MMHLLHRFDIDRHFRGELGGEATERMMARLWQCPRCRNRYDCHLLLERALPTEGRPAAEDRLWNGIVAAAHSPSAVSGVPAATPVPRRPQRFTLLATALAGAFAAALVLVSVRSGTRRGDRMSDPVSRGSEAAMPGQPTFYLYRSVGEHRSERVAGRVRSNDGLLVAYSNPSRDLKFLLVFGVDSQGTVYWYYPAYERLGDNPAAVPIRTQDHAAELREEIRHALKPGDLRVFAVFLPRPLRVLDMEQIVRREFAARHGSVRELARLPLADGAQASTLLEVAP